MCTHLHTVSHVHPTHTNNCPAAVAPLHASRYINHVYTINTIIISNIIHVPVYAQNSSERGEQFLCYHAACVYTNCRLLMRNSCVCVYVQMAGLLCCQTCYQNRTTMLLICYQNQTTMFLIRCQNQTTMFLIRQQNQTTKSLFCYQNQNTLFLIRQQNQSTLFWPYPNAMNIYTSRIHYQISHHYLMQITSVYLSYS